MESVRVKGIIKRESAHAICISTVDGDGLKSDIWFPFSTVNKIERNSENIIESENKDDVLYVEHWIAKQKGLV